MSVETQQLEIAANINKQSMEIRYKTFIERVLSIYEKDVWISDVLLKIAKKCHICRTTPTVLLNMGAYEKKRQKIKLTEKMEAVTPKRLIAAVNKYKRRSRLNIESNKAKALKTIELSKKSGQTSIF
jgi:hypothetical protein